MAAIKHLPKGRARVSWYDESGIRHRSVLSHKEAQALFEQICAKQLFEKSGIGPITNIKSEAFKKMKMRELGQRYLDEHLLLGRAASNANYVRMILKKWGEYKLPMITNEQVRPWIFSFLRQPFGGKRWSISSIKKLAVYFKRMFNWAIEMEIIDRNPIEHLVTDTLKKEFRRVNRRTSTITPGEFWNELVPCLPLWLKRLCIAAWCSGMRENEAIGLKRKDYNLVTRLIRLKADATKEGDYKTIGIEQELYNILIEIETERPNMKPDDLVFLSISGWRINQQFLGRKFKKYASEAGFSDFKFHDLRHCYTVRKRREGHDKSVIKAQTGHHTDSMFDWYDKVEEWELQEMAGYTQANLNVVGDEVRILLEKAGANGIPLGAIQSLIGRLWRAKVA